MLFSYQISRLNVEEFVKGSKVTTALVVPTMLARIVESLEAQALADAGMPHLNSLAWWRDALSVISKATVLFPGHRFSNAGGFAGNQFDYLRARPVTGAAASGSGTSQAGIGRTGAARRGDRDP